MKCHILILALTCCSLVAAEWEFTPPPGAELVNVKDYGAVGDGAADDTAAISKAIAANIDASRYRANRFIFLPKGTYKVSGPIEGRVSTEGWSAGWRSMLLLVGESRRGTVIRLADQAAGYGDPAKPKWVLACGSEGDNRSNQSGGGNRAFRHAFLNFTVDVGAGNPGAIAIDFIASNRGCIEGVTIRAPEGSGHTGIGMTRAWPGPAYVGDVSIEGFACGMRLDQYQYGMTFEGITMRGQREAGIANTNNMLAMRKIDFVGNVPFYRAAGGHSFLSLLDSTLTGKSGAAISTGGYVNLRRVTCTGFEQIIDDTSKANKDLAATPGTPTVVVSHDLGQTFGTVKGLDLPIEDAPYLRPGKGDVWTDGGTTRASLQAAIDGGAEWIFIRGGIELDQTLIVRGKTRLIQGLAAHLKGLGKEVAVRIEDGLAKEVVFDQIYVDGIIEQASSRTFALRHGDHGGFHATGSGKSFVVDVIGKDYLIGSKHRFWARQLNAEFGNEPLFTNEGTSWILGFKLESSTRGDKSGSQGTPALLNRAGGRLEMFTGHLYTLGSKAEQRPAVPAFTNEKGRISLSWRLNGIPTTWYDKLLQQGAGETAVVIGQDTVKPPGCALMTDER